jgi:tetratricopeptide (TPR) repeat protein
MHILLLIATMSAAAAAPMSKGFDHFYNLEYDRAIAEFEKAIEANPKDAERRNHLAQALLYREMFKAGALESEMVTGANPFLRRGKLTPPEAIEKRFFESIESAISLSESAIAANASDARAHYSLAVGHGLRGNWNFLVKKAYFDALRDLTASRKASHRVLEIDPQLIDAKLILGVHEYVVGSLPAYVRMMGFLAGFRGDREGGIRQLVEVAEHGKMNEVDARILLGVIYRREKRPQEAITLLDGLIKRFPRNYLFWFETAQMWADLGDGDKALAAVDKLDELRRAGHTGYGSLSAEKVAFARGNIQFWYNDLPKAAENLTKAAQNAKTLDLHTGTMAWLRLGQTRDLLNQREQALEAYRHVLQLAPDSEMAKESKRYLSSPYKRDKG